MSDTDGGAISAAGEEATLDAAVYVRGDARSAARERQRAIVERFEELAAADRIGRGSALESPDHAGGRDRGRRSGRGVRGHRA